MDTDVQPFYYNITQDIDRYATTNKVAIEWMNEQGDRRRITYQYLKEKSDDLAKGLLEQGLEPGDRVFILLPRIPEAYLSYLACLKAGLIILPGSEMLQPMDIRYRVQHAGVKGVIATHFLVQKVEEAISDLSEVSHRIVQGGKVTGWINLEEIKGSHSTFLPRTQADDLAFISYTSGTTGGPKGVMHTHRWAIAHQQIVTSQWLGIQSEDIVWATAGPGWAKWIWSPFISTLGSGATAFVYQGSFAPEKYLSLIQDEKINVLCCTPTEYRMMAKTDHLERFHLSSLRHAVSAGEPLNREVIATFDLYFHVKVRDGYGQTENSLLIGTLIGTEIKPGSMGKAITENKVTIVDDHGNEVLDGKVGHIAVHRSSPVLFQGYYQDEQRTKEAFRGEWYITGDLAKRDKEGYFWFEGRSDDMIISSGYTIGPFEVEDALIKHSSVKECAVVASPDPIRGSIVKAFVILQELVIPTDKLIQDLQNYVKQITAPYKYPREIEFVSTLPKTTSGKIRRIELRELEKKRKEKTS
jgi:acetyl-CoA synthetase